MKRKKEKILKKSMRESRRYILFEKASKDKVEKAILDYIGILGYAKASPEFVRGKTNVLAVNKKELDKVKGALELTNINVKRVSGTLKGLRS